MKRYEMIKDKKYFSEIIKKGKFAKDKNYVIYYYPAVNQRNIKFGIAIKSSIGKANVRNRLKRQTRNIIDLNKKLFKKDLDYIIMIRTSCLTSTYDDMNNSIVNILKGI